MKRMGRRERKRRVFALIISAVVLCFLAAGCSLPQSGDSEASGRSNSSETVQEKNAGQVQRTVFAMNTMMNLRAFGENAEAAIEAAEEEIRHLDTLLQRGEESSEIYQLNSSGSREVSEETLSVIKRALEIAEATDGAFDPSIAPAADLWGFYGQNFRVPSPDEISSVLPTIGWKKISIEGNRVTLQPGTKIDLGGIAKGFLSGKLMEIFRDHGVETGIVSLGGNVQTLGEKTDGSIWKVALQDPDDPDRYLGQLSVADKAVVTSGSYQQHFEKDGKEYHHILDPKTGWPADSGLTSVTIICEDGARVDGLSTALFVMGAERGIAYWKDNEGFDAIFVTADRKIYVTEGLEGNFECADSYEIVRKSS